MAILTPFSYSFSCPQGSDSFKIGIIRFNRLKSLTVEIEDDGLGPILINAYVLVEGKKHQIGSPTSIWDGEGYNAKRFMWTGEQPISIILQNVLTIQHGNNSGEDIKSVRVSGVLQR